MTADMFVYHLTDRHAAKSEASEFILDDIKNALKGLSESKIDAIWDYYLHHYQRDQLPRASWIYEAMRELGISYRSGKPMVYECQKCGTLYSLAGRGCPVCREMTPVKVVQFDKMPKDEMVHCQADCFQCGIYHRRAYGPVCKDFGTGNGDPKFCASCECAECCRYARMYHDDPALYMQHIRDYQMFDPMKSGKKVEKREHE